jgi:hypothetical protein
MRRFKNFILTTCAALALAVTPGLAQQEQQQEQQAQQEQQMPETASPLGALLLGGAALLGAGAMLRRRPR